MNETEICKFKGLHTINSYQNCLESVPKSFTINEAKEIDTKNILNIHEYLMTKNNENKLLLCY